MVNAATLSTLVSRVFPDTLDVASWDNPLRHLLLYTLAVPVVSGIQPPILKIEVTDQINASSHFAPFLHKLSPPLLLLWEALRAVHSISPPFSIDHDDPRLVDLEDK